LSLKIVWHWIIGCGLCNIILWSFASIFY
jgi:hypothetical protein